MKEVLSPDLQEVLADLSGQEKADDQVAFLIDKTCVKIDKDLYRIVYQSKENLFDIDAFNHRYADVLAKYDYIVGDWGFEQLRLKGFFEVASNRQWADRSMQMFEDYILEYCNFGCDYFVLEKEQKSKPKRPRKRLPKRSGNKDFSIKKEAGVSVKKEAFSTTKRGLSVSSHKSNETDFSLHHKRKKMQRDERKVVSKQAGFQVVKKQKGK